MIKNLEEKTGKSLQEWIKIVKEGSEIKHNDIIKSLKTSYGLTHGYANLIAHKAKGSDAGSANNHELIENQYKGKEALRPIYDCLIEQLQLLGEDIEIAPKRAYVSLRRKKQFGLIQPSTKTRVDIGINLKGKEATDRLILSGSWNTMVSHRVKTTDVTEINEELINWIKEAYEAAG